MDRSRSLHWAGITLYFMSGPEAPYYFAINFIPYRTMSHRQRYLSFWHLSASLAQIKRDSLIPKSVLQTVGVNKQLCTTQSRHLAFMLDLKCFSNIQLFISQGQTQMLHLKSVFLWCVPLWHGLPFYHRVPTQITISLERDRYPKCSKWRK